MFINPLYKLLFLLSFWISLIYSQTVDIKVIGLTTSPYSNLKMTSEGNLWLAYLDGSQSICKVVSFDGVNWNLQFAVTGVTNSPVSIAMDSLNNKNLVFIKNGYVTYSGWLNLPAVATVSNIDLNGNPGNYSSLVKDTTATMALTYQSATLNKIRYAKLINGSWTIQNIFTSMASPSWSSLVLDKQGRMNLALQDPANGYVIYSGWLSLPAVATVSNIDIANNVGLNPSFIRKPNGNMNVSYYDANKKDLKFAKNYGTGWDLLTIDENGDVGNLSSINIFLYEKIGIAYNDLTNGKVKYAEYLNNLGTPPNAPQNLSAVPGNEHIVLYWSRVSDSDLKLYRIYGGTSASPNTKIDSVNYSDTTKIITNLTNGTTYYYRITAVDSTGNESGFSNEVSIKPYDLVASYPFNGNANDESGNGNHGTVNGATLTTDRFGNANKAYSFNGSTNYINVPDASSLDISNKITASVWVYIDNLYNGDIRYILDKYYDGVNYSWLLSIENSKVRYYNGYSSTSSDILYSQTILQKNTWYNITVVTDSNLRIYINGILDATLSKSGNLGINNKDLFIGKSYDNSAFYQGSLDDIRIYNRALSQSEIDSLYYEGGYNTISYGGKTYHTVTIGAQTWLKENLDIGTMIQGSQNATNNGTIEKYCYDNLPANCETYGGLYQWNEAMQYVTTQGTQGICPTGWHIPTYVEFQTLKTAVNSDGNALKAIGQGSGGGAGTNTSGFSALLAGFRFTDGSFDVKNIRTDYWITTYPYSVHLINIDGSVSFADIDRGHGFSIRCLKNETTTATLQLTSPNGGENWTVGTQQNITWTNTNVTNVKLEYTTNNGTDWTEIIGSTSASTGSYPWTVLNTPSTQCKVRISDASNPTVNDVSDNLFAISVNSTNVGLIAYYPFNGNANDESGNGNNGTVNGATLTSDRFNQQNTAYSFNGSSSITVPSNSAFQTTAITVSAWFYLKQGTNNYIYQNWPIVSEKKGIHIRVLGNKIEVGVGVWHSPTMITSQGSMQLNNWHNVIFTYNGITAKIYLDGIQSQSQNITTTFDPSLLYIGANDLSGNKWNGYLDDIRIYNRALTTSEVSELYNENGFAISYGGKTYHTVTIGAQTWLKENLDIGTMIQGSQNATNNSVIEKYCYNNLPANCETYGGLYQWDEAMQYVTTQGVQGICPTGWHIPTYDEFQTLKTAVNSDGNALKAIGQGSGGGVGTNASGFFALLAGGRNFDGTFWGSGNDATFISSTQFNSIASHELSLNYASSDVTLSFGDINDGNSIRCLKNSTIATLQLSSPNGEETWTVGTQQNITWTSANVTNVKLEYTTNNGTDWTTIIASTPANAGSYAWTIPNTPSPNCKVRVSDASNSSVSDLSDNNFTISIPSPTPPTLATPQNNATGISLQPNLVWYKSSTATAYHLQFSKNNSFDTLIVNDSTLTDSLKQISSLANFTQYYWRVRAKNQYGWSGWSNVWTFLTIIAPPQKPQLALPANNALNQPIDVSLLWNSSATTQYYSVQVATDANFTNIIARDTQRTELYFNLVQIQYNTKYYWRVNAKNEGGTSAWSDVWNFTTTLPKAALNSPGNGSVGRELALQLSWNAVSGADRYHYQLSASSNFASVIAEDSLHASLFVQVTNLLPQTNYYWRVRAGNTGGYGGYSEVWSFKTKGAPNTVETVYPLNNSINIPVSLDFKWKKPGEQVLFAKALGNDDGEKGNAGEEDNPLEAIQKYWFELTADTSNASAYFSDSTLTDTTFHRDGLTNYTFYYWRIRAKNEAGWNNFTGWNKFRTIIQAPSQIVLSQPDSGAVNQPLNVTLQWQGEPISENYILQVSLASDFQSQFLIVSDTLTSNLTSKQMSNLIYDTEYFWRVKGKNIGGEGVWSKIRSFRTIIERPSIPLLSYPLDNSKGLIQPITFKWKKSLRGVSYRIQISSDNNFTNIAKDFSGVADTFKTIEGLNNLTEYYWRVSSTNIGGTSDYSLANKFKTLGLPTNTATVIPSANSINQPIDLTFYWRKAFDQIEIVSSYWFELKKDTLSPVYVSFDSTLTDTTKSVSGLEYLTNYYWRVRAKNEAGWNQFTGWSKFTTIIEKPATVQLSSPENNAPNQPINITLNWQQAERAEYYEVQLSTDSTFEIGVMKYDSLVTLFAVYNNLDNSTKYYWRVRGKNLGGIGNWSAVWNFITIIAAPANFTLIYPPDNAVGIITPDTLKWNISDRAEKYVVEVSTNANFTTHVMLDTNVVATKKLLPKLQDLTQYFWRITAKNIGGATASSIYKFKTLGRPTLSMPLQPPNNAVNQPIDGLEFKWTKSKDQLETIQRYWFQLATDSVTLANLRQDSTLIDTSKVESGLNNLTYYYWRVRAENETGWGGWSYWSKFRTIIQSPSQVRLFKPDSASINQPLNVNLQWLSEPITDNYHLQVSTDANFLTLLLNDSTLTASSKSVSLNYNQTIYWRVRGKNVGGNGPFSNVWHFSTKLAAPNLLLPDSGAVNISIHPQFNWTPVAGAAQYHLQVAKNAGFNPLVINDSTITTDTITKGPLENNQTYYWRVRGRDGLKSGDYSSVRDFTTIIALPSAPLLNNPPNGAGNLTTNFIFSWNAVFGANNYRLQLATDSGFTQIFFDTVTAATSKEVRNMAITEKYYWRVAAQNIAGFGQWSEVRWFVTVLPAPENLTANAGNKRINLDWFHESNRIAYFKIYRSQTSPANTLIDSVLTGVFTYVDTNVLNNANYFYRVRAVSIFGSMSDFSNEASTSPRNLPPVAILPSATYNNAGYVRETNLNFDISQCYDLDGTIDSVFWYRNETLVSQSPTYSDNYPQGMTEIKLVIKDNDGAIDSAKTVVTITAFRKKFSGPTTSGITMWSDTSVLSPSSSVLYVIVTGNSDAVKRIDTLGNELGQQLNVNGNILSSSSVSKNADVFIGSTDYNLYGFNKNGSNLWVKPLGGLLASTPSLDARRNRLYIGTSNNRFVCIDRQTSNDIWTFNMSANNFVRYSAVISDSSAQNPVRKLFFSTVGGHIAGFKVDEITGTTPFPDWETTIADSILSSPAIGDDGLFYVGGSSGKLYKIELRIGVPTPFVTEIGNLDGAIETTPVIDSLGNIFIGTRAGSFYSFKKQGGTNWKITTHTKTPIKTTGIITSLSNRIVFANSGGELYSVTRAGQIQWYYRDSSAIGNTLLNYRGVTYWGTQLGHVTALYDSVDIPIYGEVLNPPEWPTLQATPARGGDRSMLNPMMIINDVDNLDVVKEYALLQNYPNPFNPVTTIKYALPKASHVVVKIFDILGNELETLVDGYQHEGYYTKQFDANRFSSGVYIYRIQAGTFVQNRKMILLK